MFVSQCFLLDLLTVCLDKISFHVQWSLVQWNDHLLYAVSSQWFVASFIQVSRICLTFLLAAKCCSPSLVFIIIRIWLEFVAVFHDLSELSTASCHCWTYIEFLYLVLLRPVMGHPQKALSCRKWRFEDAPLIGNAASYFWFPWVSGTWITHKPRLLISRSLHYLRACIYTPLWKNIPSFST
jgi:hypothetical protein